MSTENSNIDKATQPKVIIRCLVYNHEPYLRDCLEGFILQKTNFPFKAVVHDDCSTDGSAAIIREYAEKYPDIIEPIYETENQYSKRDGSLGRIMAAATLGRSPYIAYCEGDDYWIDPLKLQKQVDYMDKHLDCSMTCTNAKKYHTRKMAFVNTSTMDDIIRLSYKEDGDFSLEQLISRSALAYTASIVLRESLIRNYPVEMKQCGVGDYPLQMWAAICGRVHYFPEEMVVYRIEVPGSWSSRHASKNQPILPESLLKMTCMLDFVDKYTNGNYQKIIRQAQCDYITNRLIVNRNHSKYILKHRHIKKMLYYDYLKDAYYNKSTGFFSRLIFNFKRKWAKPYYPSMQVLASLYPWCHPLNWEWIILLACNKLRNFLRKR